MLVRAGLSFNFAFRFALINFARKQGHCDGTMEMGALIHTKFEARANCGARNGHERAHVSRVNANNSNNDNDNDIDRNRTHYH